ncbi:hypothetical protein [Marivirga sp.]|uniref:hypothetical protein n=1 Tax=Marivirga sp. TaxID=2018662 RepID=UPI002D7EBA24|nr:hypothetical protein [Marivirga sp.]HET8859080.1 hypothetical protein [Marivirga sp.]
MRTLSREQKEQLANHLAKKPIEYIELYNELYDHYASSYENGNKQFEEVLRELDQHFDYQKVKTINANLLKKTKKSVNEIYWKEFKNFWRWPQIVSTLGFLLFGLIILEFLPIKVVMWSVIIPLLIFNVILTFYGLILKHRHKFGNKKFDSAHYQATQHYLNLPTSIFNLSIFLPIMTLQSSLSRIQFYEKYSVLLLLLMMTFFTAAYIGFKVFRTKIKMQYLR